MHLQALCDQAGQAWERIAATEAARQARETLHNQTLRSTLLAAIAHDHRTPLANILGAASSLHDQDDRMGAVQRRQLAAAIMDEARQLTRLTDNTLQLARLDSPEAQIEIDWQAIDELLGHVLRRVRTRWPGRTITCTAEPQLPLLRCDAVLVIQALDNLIENALKFSPEHTSVQVVVRHLQDRLCLSVRDRGPGVSEALRDRVFDAFQRGEAHPAFADQRGAGLGLTVCRTIARVHGGELIYRPRRQGGACFELWLPVPEQLPTPAEAAEPR
jgi:two-component system sensor histidine kinase KdpD